LTAREFRRKRRESSHFGRDRPTLDQAAANLRARSKAILFMVSDDSSYCIGSELMVDGCLTQFVNFA